MTTLEPIEHTWSFEEDGSIVDISVRLSPYILKLRAAFGTAHSTTTSRSNALFTTTVSVRNGEDLRVFTGYGEVGLPPKKPYCYLADLSTVFTFFRCVISTSQLSINPSYDPFSSLPSKYFSSWRNPSSLPERAIKTIFELVDGTFPADKEHRAAKHGIEASLLEVWSHLTSTPFSALLPMSNLNMWKSKVSYFTVSMQKDIAEAAKEAQVGLSFTPYLKIKLDDDKTRTIETLDSIKSLLLTRDVPKKNITIDANSSWSPEFTLWFLHEVYPRYKEDFYMLEQPFPAHLKGESEAMLEEWRRVKAVADEQGCLLFADESCNNAEDVEFLSEFVTGVNIKLEKTGGIREGIRAIEAAKAKKLLIWIGIMVTSTLGSNVSAQLLPFAHAGGDLDGSLLVDPKTDLFTGGFALSPETGLISFSDKAGFQVTRR